jgi:hypothetical protein
MSLPVQAILTSAVTGRSVMVMVMVMVTARIYRVPVQSA